MHHEISDRTAAVALRAQPNPARVLDVDGTGYLLRALAARCPDAALVHGVDPAPGMVTAAASAIRDGRLHVTAGVRRRAPAVPLPSGEQT